MLRQMLDMELKFASIVGAVGFIQTIELLDGLK